ncbi:metallophosphoesterase family protein [Halorubrum lipolyticum]|uniref:Phosphodiesterase, MJ0936 family protein n=1 Tax=Halorubrum lipolyticum DSM 21995 TaxID=1227482 RepID=M0NR44_9EURY|nr:metallophosphoesterase family protein [Halorubrum lipolyticum]EMA59100.1 phosphodiesterase, MJ0936 family protein [Halorubrum lipolyticum DSM 21995]
MRIGIVSDTHDDLAAVEAAVALFEREGVDAVVHCGDFVAPFSVTPFNVGAGDADRRAEPDAGFDFYAVRGNNDGEWAVQSAVESFGTYLGEAGTLSFGGSGAGDGSGDGSGDAAADAVDVAVTHGTSAVVVDALVDCGDYDYVFHGHTHAHGVEERGDTVRVNPGGLPIPVDGADDVFRVAVLETDAGDRSADPDAVTHYELDG